jgi:EmrB/QacA subfamily drug resistance transporter
MTPPPPPYADAERQHYGLTLAVLLLATLSIALQQTMVAPALPAIQQELDVSTAAVSFVFTAFLLTASVSTPIVGRFGDMFGKERMLVLALIVFGAGSVVCALSGSIEMLIAGRAVQGLATAVFPLAFGIIRDEFPPERVSTGIGVISATFGIGGGVGLVVSGVIVDNLHYEWLFWLALPLIVVAIVATHLWVPESPVRSPARIDWFGAGLLSGALITLLLGVSQANSWGWGSARIVALFAAAAVLLAAWIVVELHQREPLVDMVLMREPVVFATNLAALMVGFGMFGSLILIPQLVQLPESTGFGLGASVTEAGIFLLPLSLAMLFAGPLAGWLGGRVGAKVPLLIGTGIAAATFGTLAVEHGRVAIYVCTTLMGLGIGFSFASMANLVVAAVPQRQTGVATGINTIMRTIGGSIGGSMAASIVAGHLVVSSGLPEESGFTLAFAISAVGVGLAFVAALSIPGRVAPATWSPPARRSGGDLTPL